MIADPLTLQVGGTDGKFSVVRVDGSRSIRMCERIEDNVSDARLTISHDENVKTKRRRSVIRLDKTITNPNDGSDPKDLAVYLVLDRDFKSYDEPMHEQALIALQTLVSFFMDNADTSATGTLTYGQESTLVKEFFRGES